MMHRCPQCQFENPIENRFCQQCGAPLEVPAEPNPSESSESDVVEESVIEMDIESGKVWRAVLLRTSEVADESQSKSDHPAKAFPAVHGKFLDHNQRYQIFNPSILESEDFSSQDDLELKVIDCQPSEPSTLELLCDGEGYDPDEEGSEDARIPAIAKLYLELQDELYPAMPQIHDAWEQAEQTVVLLEDRTNLSTLLDLLKDEAIVPFQVLNWLHDMAKIWEMLDSQNCCQSLLEPGNLRVDEDSILCLQRLFPDDATQSSDAQSPDLKALGELWSDLFQRSERTQLGSLAQLCYDLESGQVGLEDLQERLREIADELQSTPAEFPDTDFSDQDIANLAANQPAPSRPVTELSSPPPLAEGDIATQPLDSAPMPTPSGPPAADSLQTAPTLEYVETSREDEDDDMPTVVLPMKLMSMEDAGRTDVGRQRKHNEDYFLIKTDIQKVDSPMGRSLKAKGLYVLCDGMGGHAGGEVASALAVETLDKYLQEHWGDRLPDDKTLREAIYQANNTIYTLNQQGLKSGSGRMGTTLVMMLVHGTEVAIAHVGDSRLYRYTRRQGLEMLTVDHEVGQREIQRGVDAAIAYSRPDAYQLTQALGPRDQDFVAPDLMFMELNEDALLLLASDGLTDDNLIETHWRTHVEPLLSSQANLDQGVLQLVDLANDKNGHDNITVIAIRVKVRPNIAPIQRR